MTTSPPEPTGVDLARVALQAARVALQAARAAAKTAPAPKRRTGAARPKRDRGTGRDPMPFAAALERMMAERGWDMAAKGGSIIDQWPTIAPELSGKVQAVRFDEETRTLHLRPISPAYRTQLELHQRNIVAKVNDKVGAGTVTQLRILAPGAVATAPTPAPAAPIDARPPQAPSVPRAKHPMYLEAKATNEAHKLARETDMDRRVKAALEEQNDRLRQHREAEAAFTEPAAQEEILRKQSEQSSRDALEAAVRAAIAYKHTGRPQGDEPRRLFEAS
ncbi:DciA family protein [Streptomyces sp. NPDC056437]|uniref:DciA family protein n=1 Tax=Streptomyces sp. NPDC056437 TaxID=3345816 RepID=UPI003676C574